MATGKGKRLPGRDLSRLLIAAMLPTLASCGGECGARLTLINSSGLAIASGTLRSTGTREAVSLGSIPSPGTSEYRFGATGEGAYAVEIRFADSSLHRDTSLGYLTHGAGYRDTLVVLPSGTQAPLDLRQSIRNCREAPRMKTVIREILKKVF